MKLGTKGHNHEYVNIIVTPKHKEKEFVNLGVRCKECGTYKSSFKFNNYPEYRVTTEEYFGKFNTIPGYDEESIR